MIKDIGGAGHGAFRHIVAQFVALLAEAVRRALPSLRSFEVVHDALELCGAKALADAGIAVVKHIPQSQSAHPRQCLAGASRAHSAHPDARAAAWTRGGTLTMETTRPDDKLLRLRVSDSGRIKPEQLSRIFDPFFTTKAQRTDTG